MSGPDERDEIAAVLAKALYEHSAASTFDATCGTCVRERNRALALAERLLASDWLAERDRRTAATAVRDLVRDIDSTGYGWTSVVDAERFKDRLRDRADQIERGERWPAEPESTSSRAAPTVSTAASSGSARNATAATDSSRVGTALGTAPPSMGPVATDGKRDGALLGPPAGDGARMRRRDSERFGRPRPPRACTTPTPMPTFALRPHTPTTRPTPRSSDAMPSLR